MPSDGLTRVQPAVRRGGWSSMAEQPNVVPLPPALPPNTSLVPVAQWQSIALWMRWLRVRPPSGTPAKRPSPGVRDSSRSLVLAHVGGGLPNVSENLAGDAVALRNQSVSRTIPSPTAGAEYPSMAPESLDWPHVRLVKAVGQAKEGLMIVDAAHVDSAAARVLDEIERAIVGKRPLLQEVLSAILSGGHVLLEDYPGLGKTLVAKSFASALGLDFKRIQFTPDLLPSDIAGSYVLDRARSAFELRRGPVFANLILADKINRASPKT